MFARKAKSSRFNSIAVKTRQLNRWNLGRYQVRTGRLDRYTTHHRALSQHPVFHNHFERPSNWWFGHVACKGSPKPKLSKSMTGEIVQLVLVAPRRALEGLSPCPPNQPTNQPTNRPTNQPTNQPAWSRMAPTLSLVMFYYQRIWGGIWGLESTSPFLTDQNEAVATTVATCVSM